MLVRGRVGRCDGCWYGEGLVAVLDVGMVKGWSVMVVGMGKGW